MADYLIALSIGPVQGFISAARRTRDLWFGSEVLSEISKAAARVLNDNKAALIFPAPFNPPELEPGTPLNVANKLMARIDTDSPAEILTQAKVGAKTRWLDICGSVLKKAGGSGNIRSDIWAKQMDDVLEIYGAWVCIQGEITYPAARGRLERLLGARKTTRDFSPSATAFDALPGFGIPKSSLDAARETVLADGLSLKSRRILGLSKGEQLDCPGLVKRLGGDPEQFPPITRISLEPWLETIPDQDLDPVKEAFEPLIGHCLSTRVVPGRYNKLPYDGGLLFPSRIEAAIRDLEETDEDAKAALNSLRHIRNGLYEKFKEPSSYFAILMADGDRMGAFIDSRDSMEAHVAITRALAEFSCQARQIVEQHQGACVYAGGDDVLALLPIHRGIACAKALSNAFDKVVASLDPATTDLPTLSVGLGLGHILTPFGRLLDLGRRAERLAKEGMKCTPQHEQRNALALIVGTRSGAEISARGRWNSGMHERLGQWVMYYRQDLLSDRTPYDLRQALVRVVWAESREDYLELAANEAGRVLGKKRVQAGEQELSDEVKNSIQTAITNHGIRQISSELLVARWLSEKAKE